MTAKPLDLERHLNPQQLEAVRHDQGPLLVIAGAGSGKTRTIVHRLARLVSEGVDPESILLLTFTRKAAQEMLLRAEAILGRPLTGTSGGTFHSFAFGVLRRNAGLLGSEAGFTLMDRADSENLLRDIRANLEIAKGDKTFPRKNTLADCVTKSRNKEISMASLVEAEAFHLTPHLGDLEAIAQEYEIFKREHGLLDYDDLLFRLEELLVAHPLVKEGLRARYHYVMVDEYQDTNRVQARLVRLLAGKTGNVMAVGDDAQSIYAFRGANVDNILDFPQIFTNTKLVRLEQNYRSVQPVLDLTNSLLAEARTKFDKALFSDRKEGPMPQVVRALSDQSQASLVLDKVVELAKRLPLHEIAVLFRAGYQAFPLEVALKRMGLDYQKFGGIRFHEAAHIKDVLAFLRLAVNPSDMPAWRRVLEPLKGIGPKTADRIARSVLFKDDKYLDTRKKKAPGPVGRPEPLGPAARPGPQARGRPGGGSGVLHAPAARALPGRLPQAPGRAGPAGPDRPPVRHPGDLPGRPDPGRGRRIRVPAGERPGPVHGAFGQGAGVAGGHGHRPGGGPLPLAQGHVQARGPGRGTPPALRGLHPGQGRALSVRPVLGVQPGHGHGRTGPAQPLPAGAGPGPLRGAARVLFRPFGPTG